MLGTAKKKKKKSWQDSDIPMTRLAPFVCTGNKAGYHYASGGGFVWAIVPREGPSPYLGLLLSGRYSRVMVGLMKVVGVGMRGMEILRTSAIG